MAWRVIGIQNPSRLSLRDNQLAITQDEEVSLPIEDIDALILDSYGITTTANLLTELATNNTTVSICQLAYYYRTHNTLVRQKFHAYS